MGSGRVRIGLRCTGLGVVTRAPLLCRMLWIVDSGAADGQEQQFRQGSLPLSPPVQRTGEVLVQREELAHLSYCERLGEGQYYGYLGWAGDHDDPVQTAGQRLRALLVRSEAWRTPEERSQNLTGAAGDWRWENYLLQTNKEQLQTQRNQDRNSRKSKLHFTPIRSVLCAACFSSTELTFTSI